MEPQLQWEYKTLQMPEIDDWLALESIEDPSLAFDAARGEGQEKVIDRHCEYMNATLSALGREGWELVAMWQSQPTTFFRYAAHWMTFKRLMS
jgi:hypothetical protein